MARLFTDRTAALDARPMPWAAAAALAAAGRWIAGAWTEAAAWMRERWAGWRVAAATFGVALGLSGLGIVISAWTAILGKPWLYAALGPAWWVVPVGLFGALEAAATAASLRLAARWEQAHATAQHRYHETLTLAARSLTEPRDVGALTRQIVYVVNAAVGASYSAIFLVDDTHTCYRLTALRHAVMLPAELSIRRAEAMIAVLEEMRRPVRLSDVERWEGSRPEWAMRYAEAAEWMRNLEARLVVPSFLNERLAAVLVVGAKRSGRPYSEADVQVFAALSRQAALALARAQFTERFTGQEAALLERERLASLGQMSYGMADELHNALTIIAGEAELYLDRGKGEHPAADETLSRMIAECHRAAELTRRILKFGLVGAAERHPVDLRAAVEDSVRLAAYQTPITGVKPHLEWPESLPKVLANWPQLQTALVQVIAAASAAMAPMAHQDHRGGRLEIAGFAEPGQVVLRIRDAGPAITPERLAAICEPPAAEGAGRDERNLFVAHRIIQAHHGTLHIESLPERGTTVTLSLPTVSPTV
ncbi:MAG: GAF domain-containing protein [Candidatus Omnitrophica bacterium]|nr:GAF domain-containing protein [Candidatus Omnitrophota bacterium]